MGQAKRRRSALLANNPYCCFCGGVTAATTVEHMPPRTLFFQKHRPKGLEFPSCAPCNSASSQSDQIVASLAFMMGSTHFGRERIKEYEARMQGTKNNVPQFDSSIYDYPVYYRTFGGLLKRGYASTIPLEQIERHVFPWIAKLGSALYFHEKREALPVGARLLVSQGQVGSESEIREIFELFPKRSALVMGDWDTRDQFEYGVAESESAIHFVSFLHRAFVAFISIGTGARDWTRVTKLPPMPFVITTRGASFGSNL